MPDHPYTIDRWDDATGENLMERITWRQRLSRRAEDRAAVKRWPKG